MDSAPVVKPEEQAGDAGQENTQRVDDEFAIKHPLQHSWALWFDNPQKKTSLASWGDYLKKIYTFSTVEDFWSLWNNVKAASELPAGCSYHIFKDGIEPKWEDSANERGGKWVINHKSSQRNTKVIDQMWLGAVLAVIGASFDDDDEVCGVVISIRKGMDRIAIWTKTATNEAACKRIGQHFRESMGAPTTSIGYQAHADALARNSSFRNSDRYELS